MQWDLEDGPHLPTSRVSSLGFLPVRGREGLLELLRAGHMQPQRFLLHSVSLVEPDRRCISGSPGCSFTLQPTQIEGTGTTARRVGLRITEERRTAHSSCGSPSRSRGLERTAHLENELFFNFEPHTAVLGMLQAVQNARVASSGTGY